MLSWGQWGGFVFVCFRLLKFYMAAPTKNQKIVALVKLVKNRSRGVGLTAPPPRTVLETLMFAALLENATFDKAGLAYTVLENYYIDWNEIRVCSVRELADTLIDLPNPEAAAERMRKALQGIFEKTYTFDLEEMRKKGKALAEHIKSLESMSAGTPYMIQYAAQVALDGHLIPFDEASLRIMRRLGLSQISSDGKQEICTGIDRVVLKKHGLTFAAQLHHFAAGYYEVPDDPELLSLLSKIDPEAVSRSWTPPVFQSSSPTQPPISAKTPKPERATASKSGKSKASGTSKSATPATKPAGSVTKPVSPPKLSTKPVKKPVPMQPAAKVPKKPMKSTVNVKKMPSKVVKSPPSKKENVPGKKQEPTRTPVLPKKRAVMKKGQATPVKKPKSTSPSKSLRKKKPK